MNDTDQEHKNDQSKREGEGENHPQQFFSEKQHALMQRIRKLQEHARINIAAEMAQKAKNAFNVNTDEDETVAYTATNGPVAVLVYPQNPFIGEPEIREMTLADAHPGLMNARVRIRDSQHPIAKPDEDNNYLYWPGTPEFNQVNAFYYTTLTLRMFEKFADRAIPWAFTAPRLFVDPHVGNGMNAYYDEQDRRLGFFSFQVGDEVVNTAQSADVVSHEAAHAVLDGIRDLYNESFGLGPLAFHESFADMATVLVALQDDSLVRRLLDWTGGDLRMENFVSEVAEHVIMSMTNRNQTDDVDVEHLSERTIYLRNAVNKFRNLPFENLPYLPNDPVYELGRESHNYSRLFTGAFYDIMVEIYEHIKEVKGEMARIAIHRAREVVGHLLVYAVELGPVGELDFGDMARAFLTANVLLYEGAYNEILIKVFGERGILPLEVAREHVKQLAELPELILPERVDTALEAGIFLVEEVAPVLDLPDVDFTPLSAHRNRQGYAFLTFFMVRTVTLDGPQFEPFNGSTLDAFGGLTLAFDPTGRLRSAVYRPVTDTDVDYIRRMTLDLIEYGLVTESALAGDGKVLSDEIISKEVPSVLPRFLYMENEIGLLSRDQKGKLVRVPMILDAVPYRRENFIRYLKEWQRRLGEDT